jgi:ribose 5-phosphate isomerase B
MLSLGQRLISGEEAVAIMDTWLTTPFEGGRHARRIALVDRAVVREDAQQRRIR